MNEERGNQWWRDLGEVPASDDLSGPQGPQWISLVSWGKGLAGRGGSPAVPQVSKAAADPSAQFCTPCTHSSGRTKANPRSQDFPNARLLFSHQEAEVLEESKEGV